MIYYTQYNFHCTDHRCQRMEEILSPTEVSIATSYWSDRKVELRELNAYQNSAIKLAWANKFSMIQGPPGVYM